MNRPLMLNDMAGEPVSHGDSAGVVDVILDRLESRRISVRMVSAQTGIKKSRASNILHRDPRKRHPMRIDEKAAILQVVGLTYIEAALAADIMATPEREQSGQGSIATMLDQLLEGLPSDIAELVEHIDGVDYSDVRPEHGIRLRALLLRFLEKHYKDIGDRRLRRFDGDDQF